MAKALQAFLNFCYIVQCDVHDTEASKLYKMHSIGSISTMKYSKQVVFVPMALIYLSPMQQYIICASFKYSVP